MPRIFASATIAAMMLCNVANAQEAAPVSAINCDNPANAAAPQCSGLPSVESGLIGFNPVIIPLVGIAGVMALAGGNDGGSTPNTNN